MEEYSRLGNLSFLQLIVVIGEVYDPNQYRNYVKAGFDYLYDKVGMYDCLRGVVRGEQPIHMGSILCSVHLRDD